MPHKGHIEVPRFCQMHDHWREGEMFESVAPHMGLCLYTVPMPNLKEPITSRDMASLYEKQLVATKSKSGPRYLMTIQVTPDTDSKEIRLARDHFWALKILPLGVTTNSKHGIEDFSDQNFLKVIKMAGKCDKATLIHCQGKTPNPLDGEEAMLGIVEKLITRYPKDQRFVLEHFSTEAGIAMVKRLRKQGFSVGMTLTLHGALKTICDTFGSDGQRDPFLKVQPPLQISKNRDAVFEAMMEAEAGTMKGRDCAAHPEEAKLKGWDEAPSGIFTPDEVDIPLTYWLFQEYGGKKWRERFERFVRGNAIKFHTLANIPSKPVRLVKEDWEVCVPTFPIVVRPFMQGEILHYRLAS
ncbi:MAG: hypothetical protein NTZ65_03420 [Candidatus Berkelbacteria bacterium]|nr:hypothetical protein [Candidatus Berkelbacteria bacterium]